MDDTPVTDRPRAGGFDDRTTPREPGYERTAPKEGSYRSMEIPANRVGFGQIVAYLVFGVVLIGALYIFLGSIGLMDASPPPTGTTSPDVLNGPAPAPGVTVAPPAAPTLPMVTPDPAPVPTPTLPQ